MKALTANPMAPRSHQGLRGGDRQAFHVVRPYSGPCARGFMISLAILSLLAGAVLRWCFTVPVLVLAIMLAVVVVAGAGAAVASLWWIALDVFVVTICLQVGYVAGSALETYTAFRGRRRAPRESSRAADASSRPHRPWSRTDAESCSLRRRWRRAFVVQTNQPA